MNAVCSISVYLCLPVSCSHSPPQVTFQPPSQWAALALPPHYPTKNKRTDSAASSALPDPAISSAAITAATSTATTSHSVSRSYHSIESPTATTNSSTGSPEGNLKPLPQPCTSRRKLVLRGGAEEICSLPTT